MIGNYVESAAGVQQSSASLVDIFQGSFIGQLLNSLGNLKKIPSTFLNYACTSIYFNNW